MVAHRVTETQLFKLLQKRECKDGFEGAQISSRVNNVVAEAWPILQQVSRSFPLYTLHDPEHSFRVAANMIRLIPKSTLSQLNSIELSLLLYCAYLHDIGMASSQQEFYTWLESDQYQLFVSSHERWERALRQIEPDTLEHPPRHRTKKDPKTQAVRRRTKEGRALRLTQLQDVVYTEFLRSTHASRSADYVITRFGNNGKSDNKIQSLQVNYANEVALVCKSHWEETKYLRDSKYRRDLHIGTLPVNLQYCAVILRLADMIDLDPERTPKVLLDFILLDLEPGIQSPQDAVKHARLTSAREWAKHRAVLGYKITPEEIRIEARCAHPAIQRGLREWCDYIDQERRECRFMVQDNPGDITNNYKLLLSNEVRKEFIESDGSYIYSDFKFQLDYDRIVNLLMGTELWGDPLLAIRELLQNALDACAHRQALSQRKIIAYTPKISFHIDHHYDEHKRQIVLTCEDNGTGMNQFIIENYLIRLGQSYYNSEGFRRQNLDFFPISQFGLGIMSCFMLTDKVRIHTQRVDEAFTKHDPLLVQIDSLARYVILRPAGAHREGTAVSLIFDDDMFMGPLKGRHRFHHPMMLVDTVHHAIRSLAVHLDLPIEVSSGEDCSKTIEPGRFTVPQIDWDNLPCMKDRYREFVFEYTHKETGGLAGKFRFLLPCNSKGSPCLACAVGSRFKMFIDKDGDLCLTTPDYEDDRIPLDFGIPDDWDTDEVRGVYRDRYGRKPPASEERYGSDTNPQLLEVVKSSFRSSQDGLFVGTLTIPWGGFGKYAPAKADNGSFSNNLFSTVDIPGLNVADIDIRGPWRVKLNVQRTAFLIREESLGAFQDRLYGLAADMWRRIIHDVIDSSKPESVYPLVVELFRRSNTSFEGKLSQHIKQPDKSSPESCASAYLAEVTGKLFPKAKKKARKVTKRRSGRRGTRD